MNSQIIPMGLSETVTDGTILAAADTPLHLIQAHTDLVISSISYLFAPKTAGTGAVTAFTLPAGQYLFNVKAIVFTGTATYTYRHKAKP